MFVLFTLILVSVFSVDGFVYATNPCEDYKTCRICADAAGCGWCPDRKQCQPMAQDGFPIRTKDISSGDMDVSPYTKENLPLNMECPMNCELTELGDCNCIRPSVLNSCEPDCYAVFNTSGGEGGSSISCRCPYASRISKPGPYERMNFMKNLRDNGHFETPDTRLNAQANAVIELEVRKQMILELQKSTRIHICNPHSYIIDSTKC